MKKHSIALALVSAIVSTGAIVSSTLANFAVPHKLVSRSNNEVYVYIPGQLSRSAVLGFVAGDKAITSKANACGFLRIAVKINRPMTSFSIGATNYTLATLPAVFSPMICRKVGTTSQTYIPAP